MLQTRRYPMPAGTKTQKRHACRNCWLEIVVFWCSWVDEDGLLGYSRYGVESMEIWDRRSETCVSYETSWQDKLIGRDHGDFSLGIFQAPCPVEVGLRRTLYSVGIKAYKATRQAPHFTATSILGMAQNVKIRLYLETPSLPSYILTCQLTQDRSAVLPTKVIFDKDNDSWRIESLPAKILPWNFFQHLINWIQLLCCIVLRLLVFTTFEVQLSTYLRFF
jgi:hypothetical protein